MPGRAGLVMAKWDGLSEAKQELEWRKCQDFSYFACEYFAIKVPGKGQQSLELRDAQKETSRVWLTDRFSVTLKARQIGFSTLAAAVSLWHVMFHEDREIIMLSKTGQDARKLLSIASYAWKALPAEMRKRAGVLVRDTVDTFELDNGSKIQSLNSNNPARGYSAFLIFVDEYAFFEKAEEAWAAIEPAADVGGRIHVLSTANGVGNNFHDMWVRASTGVSDYTPIFYPWQANGRDDAWYAAKARSMPEWQLHQEYPSDPTQAFIRSGRPVFDTECFRGLELSTPEHRGFLDGSGGRPLLEQVPDGELQVWETPQVGVKYVIGADVAEGLDHGDYSVAFVINTKTGRVVAKWRGHVDPDTYGSEVLADLGRWYNRALVGVEVNNHGYTTCVALKRANYGNQYHRTKYDEWTKVTTRKLGWRTDVQSKKLMIDELRRCLREGEIKLHCGETVGELQTFVRDVKGSMHGSPFDDQVMALAVACMMRQHFFTREDQEPEDISGTFMELEMKLRERELQEGTWVIGTGAVSRYVQW